MEVLESTNTTHTQCQSNHLTQFAGGWLTVPSGINFNDVWANAGFLQNITIYMTVIVITLIYLILLIFTSYMDKKDKYKNRIKILADSDDIYFYEIIFYTGSRLNAGTSSNVIEFFYNQYN
jgi:polycystin 1L2